MHNKIYPNVMRKYRKGRGLNQKQVAMIIGISSGSIISRWENNRCLPRTINILKLARLYRVMADTLFPYLTTALVQEIWEREEELHNLNNFKSRAKTLRTE